MAEKNVYVDVKGSDANPGTAQKPLATLEKARDLVRALNWKGPVNVWLMPGTWVVKDSIVFDARDSGRKDAPITYRSQVPGKARLIGAKRIPAAAFKPITDSAILNRLE